MNDRLITIFRAANSAEAHVVRGRLAAEGIDAFVADDMSVDSLSYVGTALGGVKVNVRESDYERACSVLASIQAEDASAAATEATHATSESDWKCPECGERVPWGFDVCWSCGTSAADQKVPVGDEEPAERTVDRSGFPHGDDGASSGRQVPDFRDADFAEQSRAQDRGDAAKCPVCGLERPEEVDFCPACGAATAASVNPYRYTGGAGEEVAADPPLPAASEEMEQVVARAFRASVIGVVLCPPLICTYAMCLLLYVALQNVQLSKSGDRKFYAALFLNLLIGVPLTGLYLLLLFGPSFSWLAP